MARTDRGVFSARVQDALLADDRIRHLRGRVAHAVARDGRIRLTLSTASGGEALETVHGFDLVIDGSGADALWFAPLLGQDALDLLRSEEPTSELQSLMRISYAVFCLTKKK